MAEQAERERHSSCCKTRVSPQAKTEQFEWDEVRRNGIRCRGVEWPRQSRRREPELNIEEKLRKSFFAAVGLRGKCRRPEPTRNLCPDTPLRYFLASLHRWSNCQRQPIMGSDSHDEQAHWASVARTYDGYMRYHVRAPRPARKRRADVQLSANHARRMSFLSLRKEDKALLDEIGFREKLDAVDEGIRRSALQVYLLDE